MTQSIWTGTLRCGLLQLPVRLVPAVRDGSVRFEQRHLGCGGHVRREARCADDNVLLDASDTVRTIPLGGGDYLEVPDAEFARFEATPSPLMIVDRALSLDAVPSLYVSQQYVLLPRPGGEQAYAAFSAALVEQQCACVTEVVLRHRESTALVLPYAGGLLLSTLRAAEDVVAGEALANVTASLPLVSEGDVALARQVVQSLPCGLDYVQIRDAYRERVRSFIGEVEVASPAPPPVVDLDTLLAMPRAS